MFRFAHARISHVLTAFTLAVLWLFLACSGASAAPAPHAQLYLPSVISRIMPVFSQKVRNHVQRRRASHHRTGTQPQIARFRNDVPQDDLLRTAQISMQSDEAPRARYLALRALRELPKSSPDYLRALDMAGYACWKTGDNKGALKWLRKAVSRADNDALSPWRRAWIADAEFRIGEEKSAIEDAQWVEEHGAKYLPVHLAHAAGARARAAQTPDPDPDALAQFLETYPNYPEARDARTELALSRLAAGQYAQAADAFDYALQNYPWAPQAKHLQRVLATHQKLQEKRPTHTLQERFDRAVHWRKLRQWSTAEHALQNIRKEAEHNAASKAFIGEIRFQLAMNAMQAGHYTRADARFRTLQEDGWPGIDSWEGLQYYGWNLGRIDKHKEALKVLMQAADARGGQAGTDKRFEYLYDFGEFDKALALYDKVSRRERLDAFRHILLYFLAGDYTHAAQKMAERANQTLGHRRLQAQYWQARSLLKLGNVPKARAVWQDIVDANPIDYYGILAASRIADLDVAGLHDVQDAGTVQLEHRPGWLHWHGREDTKPANFGVIAAQASTLTAYAEELPPPPSLEALAQQWHTLFPDLTRIVALHEIGADVDARHLYRRIIREVLGLRASSESPRAHHPISLHGDRWAHWVDNRRRGQQQGWWGGPLDTPAFASPTTASAQKKEAHRQRKILAAGESLTNALIAIGRNLNAHYIVRRWVLKNRHVRGIPPTDGKRDNWLESYPRPFPLAVITQTRRADLNPYLLWSTIIVESNMNPDAISHASAYGLTQVIQKTGDRIAWAIGDTHFGIHNLLNPHTAIRYGAWYLGGLVHKFHNQESLALVGYNAGPHRVARWLDWRGQNLDYDTFLETVPFRGARNYHKMILRYVATYQMLYEGALRLYIGLGLDTEYGAELNF